jgi:hypothetical protein
VRNFAVRSKAIAIGCLFSGSAQCRVGPTHSQANFASVDGASDELSGNWALLVQQRTWHVANYHNSCAIFDAPQQIMQTELRLISEQTGNDRAIAINFVCAEAFFHC